MNLIEKLGLEKCKQIVNGAPDLPLSCKDIAFCLGSFQYRTLKNVEVGDNEVSISDLRTAIANHGTPTNKGTSIIDQFINSGGFDAAIQQQLQSELNNCSASNSSKNSIEDNCTHIRNHLSPNTVVVDHE